MKDVTIYYVNNFDNQVAANALYRYLIDKVEEVSIIECDYKGYYTNDFNSDSINVFVGFKPRVLNSDIEAYYINHYLLSSNNVYGDGNSNIEIVENYTNCEINIKSGVANDKIVRAKNIFNAVNSMSYYNAETNSKLYGYYNGRIIDGSRFNNSILLMSLYESYDFSQVDYIKKVISDGDYKYQIACIVSDNQSDYLRLPNDFDSVVCFSLGTKKSIIRVLSKSNKVNQVVVDSFKESKDKNGTSTNNNQGYLETPLSLSMILDTI